MYQRANVSEGSRIALISYSFRNLGISVLIVQTTTFFPSSTYSYNLLRILFAIAIKYIKDEEDRHCDSMNLDIFASYWCAWPFVVFFHLFGFFLSFLSFVSFFL